MPFVSLCKSVCVCVVPAPCMGLIQMANAPQIYFPVMLLQHQSKLGRSSDMTFHLEYYRCYWFPPDISYITVIMRQIWSFYIDWAGAIWIKLYACADYYE